MGSQKGPQNGMGYIFNFWHVKIDPLQKKNVRKALQRAIECFEICHSEGVTVHREVKSANK